MLKSLSPSELARLRLALHDSSRASILSALWDVKGNFVSKEWLGSRNKYVESPFTKIKEDIDNSKSISHKQLREYIGASAILHCKDGWEYFSNAVSSILKGNSSNSIHFSYYAELRASLSFLSSDGIGVFNGYNIFVDQNDKCDFINDRTTTGKINRRQTHEFVWHAINEWSNEPAKSSRILEVIRVSGKSLKQWLAAAEMLSGSPLVNTLTKDWLHEWSLDLAILNEDHNFRNIVSYNPQGVRHSKIYDSSIRKEMDFIITKWQLTTPSISEKFQILDYYLLREALEKFYDVKYVRTGSSSRPSWKKYYSDIMSNLGLSVSSNSSLINFLLRKSYRTLSPIFSEAKKGYIDDRGAYRPLGILARAFLLLRLATASIEDLLNESNITKSDLEFWWREIGIKKGLWETGTEPNQFSDLWADINTAIIDYNNFKTANAQSYELKKLQDHNGFRSDRLTQFHRAYLWGIMS